MGSRRRLLVVILFILTLVVGAGAVYVGIQLQSQPDVTPDDTSASSAACCQNSGGSCNGQASGSCGGFDPSAACNSGRGWCWCAQIANPCVPDGGGAPEGTIENFCGTGTYDGQVTLDCPPGYRGAGGTINVNAGATICSGCSSSPPPPAPAPAPAPAPPPPPPPSGGACNYGSTQARVHTDVSQPWAQSITVTCGQSFETGSFHDGNGLSFATDTSLIVTRPSGQTQSSSNGGTITTSEPGTYTLVVTTNGQSGAACTEAATVTCGSVNTPTPTPTGVPQCGDSCATGTQFPSDCGPGHTCRPNGTPGGGTCVINVCATEPASCTTNGCRVIPDCGQTCDPALSTTSCQNNHVCRDPDNNGTFTCILSACDLDPSSCSPGFCATEASLNVQKTGVQECVSTGMASIVTYTITLTIPADSSARTVTVRDDLDDRIVGTNSSTSPFLINITPGGSFANGALTWNNVIVPAPGGNLSTVLTYQVVYPQSVFNTVFANNVVVMQGTAQVGQANFNITPFCTPGTALISDTSDRIILAVSLILVGMLMYRLKLHEQIGEFFWHKGTKKLSSQFGGLEKRVEESKKKSYEEEVEKKLLEREQSKK